jgi:hypothetical protein
MASAKKYHSKYTDTLVTDAQYLVDEIMERQAVQQKRVLIYKYWNDSSWKKIWLAQIKHANELLKEVSCVQIMEFLRSKAGRNIYSLGLKKVIIDGTTKLLKSQISTALTESKDCSAVSENEFATLEDNISESLHKRNSVWELLNG